MYVSHQVFIEYLLHTENVDLAFKGLTLLKDKPIDQEKIRCNLLSPPLKA